MLSCNHAGAAAAWCGRPYRSVIADLSCFFTGLAAAGMSHHEYKCRSNPRWAATRSGSHLTTTAVAHVVPVKRKQPSVLATTILLAVLVIIMMIIIVLAVLVILVLLAPVLDVLREVEQLAAGTLLGFLAHALTALLGTAALGLSTTHCSSNTAASASLTATCAVCSSSALHAAG